MSQGITSTANRTILYRNAVKCPSCRRKTFLLTQADETNAVCPSCGGTFPIPKDKVSRIEKATSDSMVAFAVSGAGHAILLAILGTITWFFVEGGGYGPDTTHVGVVTEEKSDSIEAGAAPGALALMISTEPVKVDVADIQHNPTVQTVSITPTETASQHSAQSVSAEMISDLSFQGGNAGLNDTGAAALVGGAAMPGGGGEFFGTRADGPFVYVIDASGSMIGEKLDVCKEELKTSIQKLNGKEKFYVIFFGSSHLPMPPNPALIRASETNKRSAFQWIDTLDCLGGTEPSTAMELAMSLKPRSIFLLTDGMFADPNRVLDVIKRGNPERKIQINTIAFYDRTCESILQQIARENRKGKYRFVGPSSGHGP